MSRQVTCGYLGQASRHGAACQSPLLTAADPCIWHDCGTRRTKDPNLAGSAVAQWSIAVAAV